MWFEFTKYIYFKNSKNHIKIKKNFLKMKPRARKVRTFYKKIILLLPLTSRSGFLSPNPAATSPSALIVSSLCRVSNLGAIVKHDVGRCEGR